MINKESASCVGARKSGIILFISLVAAGSYNALVLVPSSFNVIEDFVEVDEFHTVSMFLTDNTTLLSAGEGESATLISLDDAAMLGKEGTIHNVTAATARSVVTTSPTPTMTPIADLPSPNKTFSGCLLVMDENFRLPEWLAYQYHVLPLRHVVVAVDPASKTSPIPILEMFQQELGLEFVIWGDDDFNYHPDYTNEAKLREFYIHRQRRFLEKCMEYYHKKEHKWTALYDVDEYITINPDTEFAYTFSNITGETNFRKPGAVLRYLEKVKQTVETDDCMIVPRVLFGARESSNFTDPPLMQESGFEVDLFRLDTFRFRYHNDGFNKLNGLGKPLMDVSVLGPYIPLTVRNPHRVTFQVCGSPFANDVFHRSPFRINHFLGSWEQYSHREDARKGIERSKEGWEYRADQNEGPDELTHLWLEGFIESVGVDKANMLLHNTGLPRDYRNDNDEEWRVNVEKLQGQRKDDHHAEFLEFVRVKNNETGGSNMNYTANKSKKYRRRNKQMKKRNFSKEGETQ